MRHKTLLASLTILATFSAKAQEMTYEVFPTLTEEAIPYRIPAITTARNGDLIAIADYRHCRSDIGVGRIDLRTRISRDNGRTWEDIQMPACMTGDGVLEQGHQKAGFGDPCIVADRTSKRIMVMSCSGMPLFPYSTHENHQGCARWYSMDGGKTWTEPTFIDGDLYAQLDKSPYAPIQGMFAASGRIMQSRSVRVGKFYRLYSSLLVRNAKAWYNMVIFSDDFGQSWAFLGGVEQTAIQKGADEAKVEELPDGRVLISSRCNGGRHYNIFTYSNTEKGEGQWDKQAFSGAENQGVTSDRCACNGEIQLVPVRRLSDNRKTYILLQSVPFGPNRTRVGIYYKDLTEPESYATPEALARNWDGKIQVTSLGSAYSTMTLQRDHHIGFFYEEETHCGVGGGGFTLVYKNYTIEELTGWRYTYRKD